MGYPNRKSVNMSISRTQLIVLLCLFLFIVATFSLVFYIKDKNARQEQDQAAQIFSSNPDNPTYTDIYGNPVALENFLGSAVVATTWASWSPFSASDLTKLSALAQEFSGQEVVFLGVNRKETKQRAQQYMATLEAFPDIKLVIDSEDKFYTMVGGYAMPETVVFNKVGEIVLHLRGELDVAAVRAVLEGQ